MKKSLSILALAMAIAGIAAPALAASDFPDVPSSSPYYTYIQALHSNSVVSGYPDGTFGPQKTLTRAEFCRFVVSAFNLNQNSASTPFTDIADNWGKPYIAAAYSAGIIAGMTPTKFAPDDNITREQAAAIIWRHLSTSGIAVTANSIAVSGTIDGWATPGVDNIIANKLYGPEVTQFTDGSYDYRATADMTRQEMAALIDTSMQKLGLIAPPGAFTDHVGSSSNPVVPTTGMTIDVSYQGKPSRVTTVTGILNSTSSSSNLIAVPGQTNTYKIGNIPTLQVTNETGSQNDAVMAAIQKNINDAANLYSQVTLSIDNQGNVTYQLPPTTGTNIVWKIELIDLSGPHAQLVSGNSVTAAFGSQLVLDSPTALGPSNSSSGIVYPAAWITVLGDLQSKSYTLTYSTLDIN